MEQFLTADFLIAVGQIIMIDILLGDFLPASDDTLLALSHIPIGRRWKDRKSSV